MPQASPGQQWHESYRIEHLLPMSRPASRRSPSAAARLAARVALASGSTMRPPGGELREQRRGHVRRRRGHDDGVERRSSSPSSAEPSPCAAARCCIRSARRLRARLGEQRRDALDRVHLARRAATAPPPGSRSRCRSRARAPSVPPVARELDHARDDVRAARWSARSRSAATCPRRRGSPAPRRRRCGAAPRAIAASTTSSRMPCSRSRSTMRVRVRCDVMPMPDSLPRRHALTAAMPERVSRRRRPLHLVAMGEIDLQRRDRDALARHRVEIGALAGVLRGAGRADPVDGLAARVRRLDHRLRLVPLAQARDSVALQRARSGTSGTLTLSSTGCRRRRGAEAAAPARAATRAAVSKCSPALRASEIAIDGMPSRKPSVAAATVPE